MIIIATPANTSKMGRLVSAAASTVKWCERQEDATEQITADSSSLRKLDALPNDKLCSFVGLDEG